MPYETLFRIELPLMSKASKIFAAYLLILLGTLLMAWGVVALVKNQAEIKGTIIIAFSIWIICCGFSMRRSCETQDGEKIDAVSYAHPPVSTLSLFGYLVTVLAWELELEVMLLHLFAGKKLDPDTHSVLLIVTLSLTAYSYVRGKRDFLKLQKTRGRIKLTIPQVLLVTAFMVALGATLGSVVKQLVNH